MEKNADAFRTISEVAVELALPQHVLRFWETHFPQIKPLKRAGGRRYYRPADVLLLRAIRDLLHQDGYTIKGVQRLLRRQGAKGLRADGATSSGGEAGEGAGDEVSIPGGETLPAVDTASAPSIVDTPPRGGDALREALAVIEDCERILSAVRGPRP